MITTGMLRDDALKGKTIIVTGGGTGLGKSITRYLLQLGANVTIFSRRQEVLDNTAEELMDEWDGPASWRARIARPAAGEVTGCSLRCS